jgi:hypothetical protein
MIKYLQGKSVLSPSKMVIPLCIILLIRFTIHDLVS